MAGQDRAVATTTPTVTLGRTWIDTLTMYPDARRTVVRLLAETDA